MVNAWIVSSKFLLFLLFLHFKCEYKCKGLLIRQKQVTCTWWSVSSSSRWNPKMYWRWVNTKYLILHNSESNQRQSEVWVCMKLVQVSKRRTCISLQSTFNLRAVHWKCVKKGIHKQHEREKKTRQKNLCWVLGCALSYFCEIKLNL